MFRLFSETFRDVYLILFVIVLKTTGRNGGIAVRNKSDDSKLRACHGHAISGSIVAFLSLLALPRYAVLVKIVLVCCRCIMDICRNSIDPTHRFDANSHAAGYLVTQEIVEKKWAAENGIELFSGLNVASEQYGRVDCILFARKFLSIATVSYFYLLCRQN